MATIFNKRKHDLVCNGVTLHPGENSVDDQLWQKANTDDSQLKAWSKLNWISEKRSLPVSKAAPKPPGTTFAAPSVDSPVSQEPGSDMNPSTVAPSAVASSAVAPSSSYQDHDDYKRRKK